MQKAQGKACTSAQWLDVQKAWFLPYESLGVMEHMLNEAFGGDSSKRSRASAQRAIIKVVKGLRLLPPSAVITALAFGALSSGDRGLFFISRVDTQIRAADLPDNAPEKEAA